MRERRSGPGGGRAWAAAALGAALALSGPAPALGHGLPLGVRTVIDRVEPPLPGVTIVVRTSAAPQLVLSNPTREPVEVLADSGEAFLSIGPDGVRANLSSPSWYRSNSPTALVRIPVVAGREQWVTISRESSWGWFDHRMHPSDMLTLTRGTRPGVRLTSWEVPLRQGNRIVRVIGRVEYRPPPAGSVVAELTSPASPVPGVRATVLQGAVPGILLENTSGATVVVGGREGEPFLRLGPDAVSANRRSPTQQEVAQLSGASPAEAVDAAAGPQWDTVGAGSRYAWLEPRAVLTSRRPGAAVSWTVPLTVGDRRTELRGTTRFVAAAPPVQPGARGFPWPLAAGGAGAALVAFVAVRLFIPPSRLGRRPRSAAEGRGGRRGRRSR